MSDEVRVRLVAPPPEIVKRQEAAKLAEALSLVVVRTRARMYLTPPIPIPTDRDQRLRVFWAETRARVMAYLTQQAHDGDEVTARDAQQVWTTFETCFKFMSQAAPTPAPKVGEVLSRESYVDSGGSHGKGWLDVSRLRPDDRV